LVRAEWLDNRVLRLSFRLDAHWNGGVSIETSVIFSGVRNAAEVNSTLRSIAKSSAGRDSLADVVAIVRDSNRSYLVDTSQGALVIDAGLFSEI